MTCPMRATYSNARSVGSEGFTLDWGVPPTTSSYRSGCQRSRSIVATSPPSSSTESDVAMAGP